ncbi:MAG: GAF domain-containing protein, partial [Nitrospiraceae bacterium]|nr:GAF domain-containing protein [Nitrospiraceae bacterium]
MRGVHFLIGSLTCKMMALTFAIGLVTWGALDYVQGRQLKAIFNRQMTGELEIQGKDARLHFDDYVARYHKAARIFVSQTSFSDYLSRRSFRAERGIKLYTELPPWLPGPSVIRALVRIRYAVLLDGNGNIKEVYQEASGPLPPALLHPNNLLLRLSYNQSLLTDVDNVPFVLTAAPFSGRGGRIRAVLMLASPLDDDFLMSSQPSNGVLTVLADPVKKIIVASNRPDSLPDGTSLAAVRQGYHITGQSFFDAGSSDLLLNFISLIPNAQYEGLGKAVVLAERQQKAIMVFILISAFALIMLWITGRVGRLTGQIMEFSENVLHRKPQGLAGGDELGILEKQFQRLTEELTTYQGVILRNYHFQRSISSILRISLEPLYIEDKWELIMDSVLSLPFVSGRPKGCCLYLVEDNPGMLVMKVHRGYPETVPDSCREVPIDGKGLYAPAVASQQPVFAGPSANGHAGMCCGALEPHSHYFVPMVSAGEILGVMDIFLEQWHERDHEEETMLSSIADTLVQIIERDNAEREKQGLQRQLSQAEKLSALGRLTANVAHEIRNPLTSIGGFAKRLGKKLSPGTEENEFAGIIASEAGNLERILRSVLSYSREARLVLEPKDMNALV